MITGNITKACIEEHLMGRTLNMLQFALLLTTTLSGYNLTAQEADEIYLNSERLTQEQADIFEYLVGMQLSGGHYWLDVDTGLWGYGDAPPEGLSEADQDMEAPAEGTHYFEDEAAKFGFDIPPIQY